MTKAKFVNQKCFVLFWSFSWPHFLSLKASGATADNNRYYWTRYSLFQTGNAITTIKSNDPVKLMTIRGTSFEAAPIEGGSANSENSMCFHYFAS